MASDLPKHLPGARQDELVMLRIIEDMAKATAQGEFACENEEGIDKRLKGCEARFFEPEVQAVLEEELREHLHYHFRYHRTKELFNLREERKRAREVNGLTTTAATTIPTITVSPPADEDDEDPNDSSQGESEATDFSDPANTLRSIPKKGDKDRKKLWQNMEMNGNVLQEVNIPGKDGRFFTSRASIGPLAFNVNIKEASIRPIIVTEIQNHQSIKDARALADSSIANQYLTQPPMPVLVTLKFQKPSKVAGSQDASVSVELSHATIAQITQAAILLHEKQEQHWVDGGKSWEWDVLAAPKGNLKDDIETMMELMKSNPVFVLAAATTPHTATRSTNSGLKELQENDSKIEKASQTNENQEEDGETVKSSEQQQAQGTQKEGIGGMIGWLMGKVFGW